MSDFFNDLTQTPRGKRVVLLSIIAAIVIGGGLFVFSNFYIPNGKVEVQIQETRATGMISVSPNPCVSSQYTDMCEINIDYNTSLPAASIWVSVDGGTDPFLSSVFVECVTDKNGSIKADWLRHGHVYNFTLYPAPGCSYVDDQQMKKTSDEPLAVSSAISVQSPPRSITITNEEIRKIVNDLDNLTPEQKVSYLSVFYDILKFWDNSGNKNLVDNNIFWTAVEGIKKTWKDPLISDALLTNVSAQYFNHNTANFTASLKRALNELRRDEIMPARFNKITYNALFDSIIKPQLIGANNLSDLDVVRKREINESYNNAISFIDEDSLLGLLPPFYVVSKLTNTDRDVLFNSFINLINQISFAKDWDEQSAFPSSMESNHRILLLEQLFLVAAKIFDLNPITNIHHISNTKRDGLKEQIATAFNLKDNDLKLWNDLTVVVSVGADRSYANRENVKQFYYNYFKALPDKMLLLSHTMIVYGQGLRGFREKWDPPFGGIFYSFRTVQGITEPGIHGTSHNLIHYLNRTQQYGTWTKFIYSGGCKFGEILTNYAYEPMHKPNSPEYYASPEDLVKGCMQIEVPSGCSRTYTADNPASACIATGAAPHETLASNPEYYMPDSRGLLDLSLKLFDMGYKTPLKDFLFIVKIFSANSDISKGGIAPRYETNTSRFFTFPRDYYFNYDPDKINFTITEVPLTRDNTLPADALVDINSLIVDGKKYTFNWDSNGFRVQNYTVENIDNLSSASLSATPNPCSISSPQTTCSSTISWQTQNAPNACVFVKETKQLFACSTSGNQLAADIAEQGSTFEVHLTNDINSQLLASVLVKGEKQIIVQYSFSVSKSGTGKGTITSNPAGINCGSDCQESYNQGTLLTLTATARTKTNSIFKNWSGDCSGTSPTCILTMNSNKSVTAIFDLKPIITRICSTGSLRACIESVLPNPVKQGQTITFTGSGKTDDPSKTIAKYRWRLDSITGQDRPCKAEESVVCQADTTAITPGVHTVYFRVGTPKLAGLITEWSKWIGGQFTVESSLIPPPPPPPTTYQCSDNLDNDSDGKIDYPADPGCSSSTDNDERNAPPPPPSTIPAAPSNVKVVKNTNPTAYLITWQDNSNNETTFSIERKTERNNWWSRGYVQANVIKYIDTATNGDINTFRVRACNKNDCSNYIESNPIDLYP